MFSGSQREPGITGWNRMADRFFSDATLRLRFLNRLQELLDKVFTKEKLFPVLDHMESEVAADAALDRRAWAGSAPGIHPGIKGGKKNIEEGPAVLLVEFPKVYKQLTKCGGERRRRPSP